MKKINVIMLLLLLAACKKNDSNSGSSGSGCDISQSQLIESTRIDTSYSGGYTHTRTQYYSYGQNGKTAVIRFSDSAIGAPTIFYNFSGNIIATTAGNTGGNIYLNAQGIVDSTVISGQVARYYYNNSQQLTMRTVWDFNSSSNIYTPTDTVLYSWQNGNVAREDYLYDDRSGNHIWQHTYFTSDYYPGSAGKQFDVGFDGVFSLGLYPGMIFPQNFIKATTLYDAATNLIIAYTYYQPVFDANNRLNILTEYRVNTSSGTTDTASRAVTTYKYQCR